MTKTLLQARGTVVEFEDCALATDALHAAADRELYKRAAGLGTVDETHNAI